MHYLFSVPTRHKLEAEQRLEQMVELEQSGAIEVVSVEHSFIRSLLDFLTKAVVFSMVCVLVSTSLYYLKTSLSVINCVGNKEKLGKRGSCLRRQKEGRL